MAAEPEELSWPSNYFNYFTEVEEHFQRARGTGLFLLSPLDWALIEAWKDAGVPLDAVLRGIDVAFEKWRGRKNRTQLVNSVAWCTQAVMSEAQIMAGTASGTAAGSPVRDAAAPPFTLEEVRAHVERCAAELRQKQEYTDVVSALARLQDDLPALYSDLEQMEQRLTSLEDKMAAIARAGQNEEDLFAARRELDAQLRPYRGKMSAEQIAMLERQYLERRLLESAGLPRLSLFYLK